jgi:hypothetical protein
MYTILYSLYIVYCIRLVRSTGILSNSLLEASVIEASLFEAVPFKKSLWILAQPVPILEPPALGPEGVARSTPWREWQGPPRGRSGEVPPAEGVARSPRGGSGEPPPRREWRAPPPTWRERRSHPQIRAASRPVGSPLGPIAQLSHAATYSVSSSPLCLLNQVISKIRRRTPQRPRPGEPNPEGPGGDLLTE